jgi:hypothetical protein
MMRRQTSEQHSHATFEWKLLTDTGKSHRIINAGTQSGKHSIQCCYADGSNVDEQLINEEFRHVDIKIRHEIHNDPENYDLDKNDRKVK